MNKFLHAFHTFRKILTVLGALPLILYGLSFGYEYLFERDQMNAAGANIGLGLVMLTLPVNIVAWLLWLLPPYDWAHRWFANYSDA